MWAKKAQPTETVCFLCFKRWGWLRRATLLARYTKLDCKVCSGIAQKPAVLIKRCYILATHVTQLTSACSFPCSPLLVATASTYVWVSSVGLGRVSGCPQSLQPCMAAHRLPITVGTQHTASVNSLTGAWSKWECWFISSVQQLRAPFRAEAS